MIEILVILIYLSFALDFLVVPIPSEVSTVAMTKRTKEPFQWKSAVLWMIYTIVLLTWLFPLLLALYYAFSTAARASSFLVSTGICLAIIGRAITIGTSLTLNKSRTALANQTILTTGLFALSRHPIVLGLHLTLAGLLLTTGMSFLIAPYLLTLLYFNYKLDLEEKLLIQAHSHVYKDYTERTRRYLNWPVSK